MKNVIKILAVGTFLFATPLISTQGSGCLQSDGNGGYILTCGSSEGCCYTTFVTGSGCTCIFTGSAMDFCTSAGGECTTPVE